MNPNFQQNIDKDYLLLNTIDGNSYVSQREISHRTGLSLGAVNILLQKMIREGLIKMETIPANRVMYVLTPKGMAEKAEKTVCYLRIHYREIIQTQNRIRRKLDRYCQDYSSIIICLPKGELKELVKMTIQEYLHVHPQCNIVMVEREKLDLTKISKSRTTVLYLPEEHSDWISSIEEMVNCVDVLI